MRNQHTPPIYKHIWVTILFSFTFVLTLSNTISAEENPAELSIQNNALNQLIDIRVEGDYDVAATQQMINRIGQLPNGMIEKAAQSGVTLILMNFPLTDLPEFEQYKGEVPPGWEGTGSTWEDVPGAGGSKIAAARIGYSSPGNGHSTINLELHELSHSLDQSLKSGTISASNEFTAAHKEEKENLFPGNAYFDSVNEYFAETMAYYYLGDGLRTELKESAPKTYAFIQDLDGEFGGPGRDNQDEEDEKEESSPPNAPKNVKTSLEAPHTVVLNWDKVEGADKYLVLRDGKEIDSTSETSYTDKNVKENTQYGYTVVAFRGDMASDQSETAIIKTESDTDSEKESAKNEGNDDGGESNKSKSKKKDKDEKSSDTGDSLSPKITSVTSEAYDTITISWKKVDDVDFYRVLRNGKEINTTTETTFTDEELKEKTTYEYTIEAVLKNKKTGASKVVELKTGTKPEEEEDESVDKNDGSVNEKKLSHDKNGQLEALKSGAPLPGKDGSPFNKVFIGVCFIFLGVLLLFGKKIVGLRN